MTPYNRPRHLKTRSTWAVHCEKYKLPLTSRQIIYGKDVVTVVSNFLLPFRMHITPTRRPHCHSTLPRVYRYSILYKRSDDKEGPPLQIHYTSFRCCRSHSDTLPHLTGNRYSNNCDVILYVRSLFSFPFHTLPFHSQELHTVHPIHR